MKDFKKKVADGLKDRMMSSKDQWWKSTGVLAAILDPRFKGLSFLDAEKRSEVIHNPL